MWYNIFKISHYEYLILEGHNGRHTILAYHVVAGRAAATDVMTMTSGKTVQGQTMRITDQE
jgi:uncharacterized surface protein with fasciclin (FAS1) repeats